MIQKIIENILDDNFIYGFADLNGLLSPKFSGFSYGISIGRKLDDKIIDLIEDGPTFEYLEHYNFINSELAKVTELISIELKQANIFNYVVSPTISVLSKGFKEFIDNLTYEISHKLIATRAGLGWIGKTDLLVTKRFGPRLRLASILISEKPEFINKPINKSRCGKCKICVEKCPAQAANGILWNVNTYRDTFFDAHKCKENCSKITQKNLNEKHLICGICISVCPVGKKAQLGN